MSNPKTPLSALAQAVGMSLTPKAHARLSPSGAKRWIACPGSLAMTAGTPDQSNTFSDDGTAIHEVSAWCLTEHHLAHKRVDEWIVVSHGGEPVRKVKFTKDMADLAQGYVDFVRAKAAGNVLQVEQRLEFSKFIGEPPARAPGTLPFGVITATVQEETRPGLGDWRDVVVEMEDPGTDGQFGTTDAGFVDWDRGEVVIDDLKSGHTPVQVENNPQLLIYALAFLGKLYEDYQAALEDGGADDAAGWKRLKVGRHAKTTQEASDDPIW